MKNTFLNLSHSLNSSRIHGKYANGEINTKIPYIAVNDPEFIDIKMEKEFQRWLRKQIKNTTSCERVIECYDSLRTSIYLCKHSFDNSKS